MQKRFGKLQLSRETLKNLTNDEMSKVAGGRTEGDGCSYDFSTCFRCQPTGSCPEECGTLTCDTCPSGVQTACC